ncbi:MAG: peptidase M1, partial [Chitinophagaceae bacterium]
MKMKFIQLLMLLSAALDASAQDNYDTRQIAEMEGQRHSRIVTARGGSGSSGNFDVNYYRCRWEVDPAVRFINGSITVYFRITAPTSSITLDMMNTLLTDSVKQAQSSLNFSQANNTVQVNFPAALAAGARDSITIFYKGVPAETGFGSFIQSSHAGTPVMWSLSEPYGARDWWPCKNGLDDKADSIDIYVTHPAI